MSSLNYFDIAIMILFSIVSFSIYKMLKPENSDEKMPSYEGKNEKNTKIVKIFRNKKSLQHFVLEIIKNESLDLKIQKLTKLEKDFHPQSFMSWTKDIFKLIFDSFYSNRMEKIKPLVSNDIYNEFKNFNDDLASKKQSIIAEIIRFKTVMIRDVNISKKKVDIILEFVTEQTAVVKNSAGKIVKGDDNQIETIRDVWCFSKDFSQKKAGWILSKTIEA